MRTASCIRHVYKAQSDRLFQQCDRDVGTASNRRMVGPIQSSLLYSWESPHACNNSIDFRKWVMLTSYCEWARVSNPSLIRIWLGMYWKIQWLEVDRLLNFVLHSSNNIAASFRAPIWSMIRPWRDNTSHWNAVIMDSTSSTVLCCGKGKPKQHQ